MYLPTRLLLAIWFFSLSVVFKLSWNKTALLVPSANTTTVILQNSDIKSGTASAVCLPLCSYIFPFTPTVSNPALLSIMVLPAGKRHMTLNGTIYCINFESGFFHSIQCLWDSGVSCIRSTSLVTAALCPTRWQSQSL